MKILRWLMTLPLAFLAIFMAAFFAFLIIQIDEWACPSQYFISGTCMAPWSFFVNKSAWALGSAIAGFGVVVLPSVAAPTNRPLAALIYFTGGAGLVAYMKLTMEEPEASIIFWPAIVTGIAAVFAVRLLCFRTKSQAAEISLKSITR